MATTYEESTSGTLPYYNELAEQLMRQGQTQMQAGMAAPPPSQQVAGFSPLQQLAFQQTQGGLGSYQPLLNQSQQMVTGAVGQSQFDPSKFQGFMNPYTSGVVNEIGRLGQEQFQQNIVPTLSNAFGGLGQFGSARQAAMLADAAGRSQREILGQQSQALNTGYNQSMQDYLNWANLGVGAQQQAGSQLGNLAQAQQQLQLGDIGALSSAGQLQQGQTQREMDLPLANFQQQQQYPWEQINQWANLFKVPTPQQNTQWKTSFKKGGLVRGGYANGGLYEDDLISGLLGGETQSNPMLALLGGARRSGSSRSNELYENISREPSLQQVEQRPVAERIGEAMMRASAQGPGNFGQLIGRSGAAFFDEEEANRQQNTLRALKKAELLERVSRQEDSVNAMKLSQIGRMLVEMGYTPGTPEFNTKMEELLAKKETGGEMSVAGKIARDEGLQPGTPEYGARVREIVEFEQGVKARGLDIREDTAGTYSGNLGARRQEQEAKYGALPPVGISPQGMPAQRDSRELPRAEMKGTHEEIMADINKIGDPVERQTVKEAYERQRSETFSRHPGVLKFVNQGLPLKSAIDRFETEGKEYDKLFQENTKGAESLSVQDLERAQQLNERIHKGMGPGTGAWYSIPGAVDISASLPTEHGAAVGELRSLGTKMIPALTKGLTPVSNADMQAMSKAGFGPDQGYAVNNANIERAKSSLLLFKENEEFFNAAQEMGISPQQAKVEWNKYIKQYPMFDLKRTEKNGVLQYASDPATRSERFQSYMENLRKSFFDKIKTGEFSTVSGGSARSGSTGRIVITPDMLGE
jgi:hypothetical protein